MTKLSYSRYSARAQSAAGTEEDESESAKDSVGQATRRKRGGARPASRNRVRAHKKEWLRMCRGRARRWRELSRRASNSTAQRREHAQRMGAANARETEGKRLVSAEHDFAERKGSSPEQNLKQEVLRWRRNAYGAFVHRCLRLRVARLSRLALSNVEAQMLCRVQSDRAGR